MSTSSLERATTSVAEIGSLVLNEFGGLLVLLQASSHPSPRSSLQYLSGSVQPDQNCLPEIENEYQRFQLWAANLGLRGQGHWSLDYRLRDATFVKDFVIDLLNELKQTITECKSLEMYVFRIELFLLGERHHVRRQPLFQAYTASPYSRILSYLLSSPFKTFYTDVDSIHNRERPTRTIRYFRTRSIARRPRQ
jgi:hypothetical protein